MAIFLRGRSCQYRMTHRSFFFFQAEDGIRDYKVTGVQTCALPISVSTPPTPLARSHGHQAQMTSRAAYRLRVEAAAVVRDAQDRSAVAPGQGHLHVRSEERRCRERV